MTTSLTAGTVPAWAHGLLQERDPASAWPAPDRIRDGWQPATVTEVIAESPDTVTVRFALADPQPFLPGQHFNLEMPSAGSAYPAMETYSVSSSPWPDPHLIDITVKEVPGGRVSPLLVHRIPLGAVVAVEGPLGYFTWNEADGGPLVLVGAGSGIAPLMAMIRYSAAKNLDVPVRLLYSSRDRDHAIFGRELDRLADEHRWLQVVHTFTAEPADPAGRYHRRVDHDMLAECFADIAGACLAYVCGPFAMVTHVEEQLLGLGVGPGRLMTETWE